MSESNNLPRGNVFSANDALDINELASLNDDISPEFIEQLQNQLTQNANQFAAKTDDSELFEEVANVAQENIEQSSRANLDANGEDDFMKKYKAKQNKQETAEAENVNEITPVEEPGNDVSVQNAEIQAESHEEVNTNDNGIEKLTEGRIIEKPADAAQISYNDSLDFLDDNVKYSKYVIYIDPENTEFIESLTVKERKNLINRIIREQDDISITKKRLTMIQAVIKHTVIAIVTIAISIPVVYWTINASLEATINNHRRSQTIFKTLYKEKGKIKSLHSIQ